MDIKTYLEFSAGKYGEAVKHAVSELDEAKFTEKLWGKATYLWKDTSADRAVISKSLGWLTAPGIMRTKTGEIKAFAEEIKKEGFMHAVVLGMGGSSLAPLVMAETLGSAPGCPALLILDSTDPAAVSRTERAIDPVRTLFIVASKSGSTIEPLALFDYFHAKVLAVKGGDAGHNFIAITDPGTPLEEFSARHGFRKVFLNQPDIGGRYSALSHFGFVPAAIAGIDVDKLLASAMEMAAACRRVKTSDNPGVWLGAALGALSNKGCDKVSFFISGELASFGLWVEQLLAESTGKEGRGIVPVVGEAYANPEEYGKDRAFVCIRLKGKDDGLNYIMAWIESSGHPLIMMEVEDKYALGAEFMRWEVAAAASGAVIGINPFDQPDVEDAKKRAKEALTGAKDKKESMPRPGAGDAFAIRLGGAAGDSSCGAAGAKDSLKKFFSLREQGSYAALLTYLDPGDRVINETLFKVRKVMQNCLSIPVQSGYGPRYLHSTGQLHKGGPAGGLFIIIASDGAAGEKIPGREYSFGELEFSQAAGDFSALSAKNRSVCFINLKDGSADSLIKAAAAIRSALVG